jgi:RimJ/RimL family protein N-acetyltransferase
MPQLFLFDDYTVRLVTINDLQDYFALIDRNRRRLEDFFAGTVAITKTVESTKLHLEEVIRKNEDRQLFNFVIADDSTGRIIGSVQVKSIDWNIPKAELGYYIDEGYEGRGVITRATSLIIDYCFLELNMNKLFIRTHEANLPSRKVAEKNGFRLEGTIRQDYKTTSGRLVDLMYYGLLKEEQVAGNADAATLAGAAK